MQLGATVEYEELSWVKRKQTDTVDRLRGHKVREIQGAETVSLKRRSSFVNVTRLDNAGTTSRCVGDGCCTMHVVS